LVLVVRVEHPMQLRHQMERIRVFTQQQLHCGQLVVVVAVEEHHLHQHKTEEATLEVRGVVLVLALIWLLHLELLVKVTLVEQMRLAVPMVAVVVVAQVQLVRMEQH
jgi:hypothetical protein